MFTKVVNSQGTIGDADEVGAKQFGKTGCPRGTREGIDVIPQDFVGKGDETRCRGEQHAEWHWDCKVRGRTSRSWLRLEGRRFSKGQCYRGAAYDEIDHRSNANGTGLA